MLCKTVSVAILFVAIGMPSLFARDITTCYNGDEATPVGYMVNDECLTTEEIRKSNKQNTGIPNSRTIAS